MLLLRFSLLWCLFKLSVCYVCKNEPKCPILNIHSMKAADCYGRNFKSFPKCVSNNIEVLDLSYNRLRKINRKDMGDFTGLKILYLADNLLVKLDDDLFLDMRYLQVLDLSINSLATVPTHVFQLESLQKLFLSQNMNLNLDYALKKVRPMFSPLTLLDLSFTTDDDNVPEFPKLGIMPNLLLLNITGNKYSSMKASDFAGLCKMKVLASANVTTRFEVGCECWKINEWLKNKGVDFAPFICPIAKKDCPDISITSEEERIYTECQGTVEIMQQKAIMQKSLIGTGASLCIVFLVVILYLAVFRRRRSKVHENSKPTVKYDKAQDNIYV